jgi:hypothetical protein
MKMAFIVCNSYFNDRVMKLLTNNGIDYYTSWDNAKGKGHGTEPHLGAGSFASTNAVMMIAFEDEAPLNGLVRGIAEANLDIKRPSDRIRLFQLPLDRIV